MSSVGLINYILLFFSRVCVCVQLYWLLRRILLFFLFIAHSYCLFCFCFSFVFCYLLAIGPQVFGRHNFNAATLCIYRIINIFVFNYKIRFTRFVCFLFYCAFINMGINVKFMLLVHWRLCFCVLFVCTCTWLTFPEARWKYDPATCLPTFTRKRKMNDK